MKKTPKAVRGWAAILEGNCWLGQIEWYERIIRDKWKHRSDVEIIEVLITPLKKKGKA